MSKLKIYSREEVLTESLKYFKGDELAAEVWINKYSLKDSYGNIFEKSPDDMHRRISSELARIEKKYKNPISEEEIYDTIKDFKFIIPQGGPMSGIGNNLQIVSLSNCFVIGENPHDSYGSICMVDQQQIQLMKRRGGVGHDLSHIRPKGTPVKNSALTSTGVVPFMERYSNTTKEVAQDGRRGALMISISINHPDAESFIDAKMTAGRVTNANVSVKIDNGFMKSVINNEDYYQTFPINYDISTYTNRSEMKYDILEEHGFYNEDGSMKTVYIKKVDAKKIWNKIIFNAWKSAEPGILFWDNIISESIPDCYQDLGYKTVSTNPCGEIPLNSYDSCRLLALNLYSYVENPFTKEAYFNWDLFRKHVQMGQRYMDDIVDLEIEKIDQILEKIENDSESDRIKLVEKDLWENIRKMAINGRRTGHGITAEGDMLAALGYIYGTKDATNFSETIHKEFMLESYRSSVIMAKERGAFPIYDWNREKENPFINRIYNLDSELYKEMVEYGRRNIALLTIAPTGTVSLMTQTTSGIEPCFLPVYMRRRKINSQEKNVRVDFTDDEGVAWQEYPVFHHKFETWLGVNGFDIEAVKDMKKEQLDEIVKQSPYYKATANDVDWVEKVEMQGRIQKYVDHSISVTVNLPSNATEEIVAKVYERGWSSGCKGITVYRDGSRSGVLISKKEQKEKEKLDAFKDHNAPKRPKRLKADIIRFQNDSEKWIAVVGLLDGRPYELFTGRLVNGMSSLSPTIKECEVIKSKIDGEDGKKISRYDMEYTDVDGEKKTFFELNHSFNPEFWNYAKLVSGLLRHAMPLIYVYELINSLNLNDAHLNTWKAGVTRVIKKYIKDGEKVKGVCQECGSEHVEFKEGCMTCMSCGSSRCS
jgi:ribonucleoside-diphosphate reductase alpha chain